MHMSSTFSPPKADAVPEVPKRHRWSLGQYECIAEAGAFKGNRTELMDGEIVDMPSQKNPHMLAITKGAAELGRHFRLPEYWLVIQGTLRLDEHNAPEPDFFIAPWPVDQGSDSIIRPLLVIEVSDTSLLYDQIVKGSLYASHAIADYWLVNINDRQVEVYREPTRDESRQYGWRYGRVDVVRPPALVSPLFKSPLSIESAALLP